MSSNKKLKAKGSVLYTVTAVMSILTILVFAAMTLAASANRRAHNNYANNQTQFTASSVVELVWDTVSKNADFRSKINTLNSSSAPIDISVDGIDNSMGQITKAQLKCIGEKKYKLTVTAKMLGHENTVSGYYAIEPAQLRPLFEYGLRTYERCALDNVIALGGICLGVDSDTDNSTLSNTNSSYNSPMHIKGDLTVMQPKTIVLKPKTGMVVQGDIKFNEGGVIETFSDSVTKNRYMDMPYIYSYMHYYGGYGGGNIIYNTNSPVQIGTPAHPVLVLGQNITQRGAVSPIYGDLYLLGRDRVSTISPGGVQPWNNEVINKRMAGTGPLSSEYYTGGNIYSLGTVKYEVVNDIVIGTVENTPIGQIQLNGLANNIIADKMVFTSGHQGKKTQITGALVANEVEISQNEGLNNPNIFSFDKGLFVDPENFNCIGNATINDQQYIKNEMLETISVRQNLPCEGIVQVGDNIKDIGNQYWNPNNGSWAIGYSESHDFAFNASDFKDDNGNSYFKDKDGNSYFKDKDGVSYSIADFDYILDSVKINFINKWHMLHRIDMKGGIIGKKSETHSVKRDDEALLAHLSLENSGYASYYSNSEKNNIEFVDNGDPSDDVNYTDFINASFKPINGNEGDAVQLKEENTITFKIDDIINYQNEKYPWAIDTKEVIINANVRFKDIISINKVTQYLKKVNDKAFTDNSNIIQLDDIDKSVRLVRTGSSPNYEYKIYIADLKGKEGNEHNVTDFKQVAYNENLIEYCTPYNKSVAICGKDGEIICKQGVVKCVSDIDASDPNWSSAVSTFDSSNYDKFLKAVVATVTYPDSLGMKYFGLKQYEKNKNDISNDEVGNGLIATETTVSYIVKENVETTETTVVTVKKVSGSIDITEIKDEVVDTEDGNRIGYEVYNNNKKLVRCEYSVTDSQYKSVTIYRDLKIGEWTSEGWVVKDKKCKIKYDKLIVGSGSDISIKIDGTEYTCDQGDAKVYEILVGDSGKEGINGVLTAMKSANGNSLVDDRYLMGVSGVRSNGIKDIVEKVDEMFVVDGNTDKPITETNNTIYDFAVNKIIRKDDSGNVVSEEGMSSSEVTVSESCTLKGTVNRKIKVTTHSTGDINIQLDVDSFNLNGNDIIVNDENGKVNFLIPYKKNKTMHLNGNILTESYEKELNNPLINAVGIYANPIVHDTDKDLLYAEDSKIPDIYFYSEYYQKRHERQRDPNTGVEMLKANSEMTLCFGNGKIICGYFLLASANIESDSGAMTKSFNYYFDDIPMEKDISDVVHTTASNQLNISGGSVPNVGASGSHIANSIIIGAVSCCKASLGNCVLVAYVNPNPRDLSGNLLTNYLPKLQYYQAY